MKNNIVSNFLKVAFVFAFLSGFGLNSFGQQTSENHALAEDTIKVTPLEFEHALNNPLKGFRPDVRKVGSRPYDALTHQYLRWNELERNANDGIERILQVCNNTWIHWKKLAQNNSKVIPRVYLDWDSKIGNEYWPSDMQTGDYSSEQFRERLERFVTNLGKAWDNDPRVAWIQMGIIGYWGEQHSPRIDEIQGMEKLLGDLFSKAFKNKKVLVRRPFADFKEYEFGWYWDSFAHWNQMQYHLNPMLNAFPDRWKTVPMEGECAYDWGDYAIQPGANPTLTMTEPNHRNWLINTIRKAHCTGLGWVAEYDLKNSEAKAGANEVQKAFGYRYLLKEVKYPKTIQNNQRFSVSFQVENVGSAPFYYEWPVELRLLDPVSHEVRWRHFFNAVDIRDWMPGEQWNESKQEYDVPAPVTTNKGTFNINTSLPKGKYILALAILDPAGMVPSVKFATSQYFNGGNHPIGYVGIDTIIDQADLDPSIFNDPLKDKSLHYEVVNIGQSSYNGLNRKIPGLIEAEHYDLGRNGIAYYKNDTIQGDATFSSEDMVDVSVNESASNRYVVSSTNEGEWLEYTVDVTTGNYDITAYYYCGETPGNLVLSLNKEILDTIRGIQNKGWDKPDSITVNNVFLEGGTDKILRLEFINGAGFDVDALKFNKLYSPVTNVTLTDCPLDTLYVGDNLQLMANVTPYYADDLTVTWNSSDGSVATVDSSGMVTSISEGKAIISVTTNEGGFTDTCEINSMIEVISVYGLTMANCPATILQTGDTHQLVANVAPADAWDTSVTWRSSNPAIASVDENGLITAISQGAATITVITNDGGYTSTCGVGVMEAVTGINVNDMSDTKSGFVEIYPNPVSDILHFRFSESVSEKMIRIYTIFGQLLISKTSREKHLRIDVRHFNLKGMAVVQVLSGEDIGFFKVSIQK